MCSQRNAVKGELDIINKLHKLILTKCSEQWLAHSRCPLHAAGGCCGHCVVWRWTVTYCRPRKGALQWDDLVMPLISTCHLRVSVSMCAWEEGAGIAFLWILPPHLSPLFLHNSCPFPHVSTSFYLYHSIFSLYFIICASYTRLGPLRLLRPVCYSFLHASANNSTCLWHTWVQEVFVEFIWNVS